MIRSAVARVLPLVVSVSMMIGCGESERNAAPPAPDSPATAAEGATPRVAAEVGVEEPMTVLFLGTSLTAGLGLPPEQSYPAVIQEKIDSAGLPFRVINAGVSGETSAGARRRIDWLLRQPFDVLVLETGANDMLRGTSVDATRANIQAIVDTVRVARPHATIVLTGMLAAPNLGREYVNRFRDMYPELAARNDIPLVPFLLQDVAGARELNQGDGMHPNAEGQRIVAANVWGVLGPVLRELAVTAGDARLPQAE